MLRSDDVDAAVKASILTQSQADALLALARERRQPRVIRSGEDERFRFLKGFNDVFLTTGVLFVFAALMAASSARVPGDWARVPVQPVIFVAPIVVWGMAELLVGRMRAVLPGIALATAFCYFVASMVDSFSPLSAYPPAERHSRSAIGFNNDIILYSIAAALVAASAFYARFRLPFALLLIAATATIGVLTAISLHTGPDQTWLYKTAALLMGLLTFAVAMSFDMSDPERLTRRADSGFWLHLAAAPLIVHPIVSQMIDPQYAGASGQTWNALLVVVTVLLLGLVALIIDRRAILVASLSYLFGAVTYVLRSSDPYETIALPLAIVGIFVLALGLAWRPLRAFVLRPFADHRLIKKLPPFDA